MARGLTVSVVLTGYHYNTGPAAVTTDFSRVQNEPEASVDTVVKRFNSWPVRQLRRLSAE